MTDQQRPFNPDPHTPVSSADLAAIVASHDRLQAWNNLNAKALAANGDHPDAQVVRNIQSTAALIVQSEKSVSSQNFELRRALTLYDQTLSPADMAKGFAEGGWNKLLDKTNQALSFTTPGDMNLQHALARVDHVLNEPRKIAETAGALWQHPELIPAGLHQAIQVQLAHTRQDLAKSMLDEHPSHALGAILGATVTGTVIDNLTPAGKGGALANAAEHAATQRHNWHEYATLMGGGTQPPALKPLRDFSDWMHFNELPFPGGQSMLIYSPSESHRIEVAMQPTGSMGFVIQAKDDREKHGSGTEMFLSAVKKYHDAGVDIQQIKAGWSPGTFGTNWLQFMNAHLGGASMEQAAKQTFTGQMAERLGLTEVDVSRVEWALKVDHEALEPIFKRPDWGNDKAGSDYANAWVLAQGRPGLEVTPRTNVGDPPNFIYHLPVQLMNEVDQLADEQRTLVLRRMEENISRQAAPTLTVTKVLDGPGSER